MEYFIFLATIQLPFVYLIWKVFQKQQGKVLVNLRAMEKSLYKTQKLTETLSLSMDKNLDQVQSNLEKVRSFYALNSTRLNMLEKHTGLKEPRSSYEPELELKGKDFSL